MLAGLACWCATRPIHRSAGVHLVAELGRRYIRCGERFKTARLSEGFDEVTERIWQPDQVVPEHSHPFAVHALLTAGEMWLTIGTHTRHLVVGDEFRLARDEMHAERYGAQGATYLAARKH